MNANKSIVGPLEHDPNGPVQQQLARMVECCGKRWALAEFNTHNSQHGQSTLGLAIGFAIAAAFAIVATQGAIMIKLAPIFEALS